VKVGISPFGIARPGVPAGIQAGVDQYEQLGADVCRWLREDWCDYLTPQLYWPIDQPGQSFATLLPWWASQMHGGRHLWPGLNTSRAVVGAAPWRRHEIAQQIALLRAQPGASGHVHFSFRVLADNQGGLAGNLRTGAYHERAVVPASPWLGGTAPLPPRVEWQRRERDALLLPVAAGDTAWLAFQVLRGGRWRTEGVMPGNTGPVALDGNDASAIAVTPIDRFGAAGAARIVLLPAR